MLSLPPITKFELPSTEKSLLILEGRPLEEPVSLAGRGSLLALSDKSVHDQGQNTYNPVS